MAISALLKMDDALILSEEPPPLPEKLYKRDRSAPLDRASIKGQEQVCFVNFLLALPKR